MSGYRDWFLAMRPWSFTMSAISVSVGAALAATHGPFSWGLYLLTVIALVAVHGGVNLMNDFFDFRSGVDIEEVATARYRPHPLVEGKISPMPVLWLSILLLGIGAVSIPFGVLVALVLFANNLRDAALAANRPPVRAPLRRPGTPARARGGRGPLRGVCGGPLPAPPAVRVRKRPDRGHIRQGRRHAALGHRPSALLRDGSQRGDLLQGFPSTGASGAVRRVAGVCDRHGRLRGSQPGIWNTSAPSENDPITRLHGFFLSLGSCLRLAIAGGCMEPCGCWPRAWQSSGTHRPPERP